MERVLTHVYLRVIVSYDRPIVGGYSIYVVYAPTDSINIIL